MTTVNTDFPVHYMKQGDLLPVVIGVLRANNVIIDLTNATAVWFNMRNRDGVTLIEHGLVTILSMTGGQVQYSWLVGDTVHDPDVYLAEFEVVFPGVTPLRCPNNGDIQIVLTQQAG